MAARVLSENGPGQDRDQRQLQVAGGSQGQKVELDRQLQVRSQCRQREYVSVIHKLAQCRRYKSARAIKGHPYRVSETRGHANVNLDPTRALIS